MDDDLALPFRNVASSDDQPLGSEFAHSEGSTSHVTNSLLATKPHVSGGMGREHTRSGIRCGGRPLS